MAAPSPSKTTPLRIAGRFGHLKYTPPARSGSQSGSSSSADAAQAATTSSLADPAASTTLAGELKSDETKPSRLLPFFPGVADVKQEDSGLDGGGLSPSKSGYFSPVKAPSKKRKADADVKPEPEADDNLKLTPKKAFAIVRPYVASDGKYADLAPLNDKLSPENDIVFVGINPGVTSAERGHHYAGPTNRFWPVIHQSGIVPEVVTYKDDVRLPQDFNFGLTNLVARPTTSASELSAAADMRPAVRILLAKILAHRPQVVCFVGKDIWREVHHVFSAARRLRAGGGAAGKEKAGWDEPREWKVVHPGEGAVRETFFWAVSSTSGLCRDKMDQRIASWSKLNAFKTELLRRRALDPASVGALPVGAWDLRAFHVVDVDAVGEWTDDWVAKLALKSRSSSSGASGSN